jgi:hypothetical protein
VQPRFNVRFTAIEPGSMHSDFAGAAVVMACVESGDPPIRLRTSACGEALRELKTRADPDGKALRRQVVEVFLGL